MDNNELVFYVRATTDARVALSSVPGQHKGLAYEVVIGAAANSEVQIKDSVNGNIVASQAHGNILNSKEIRYEVLFSCFLLDYKMSYWQCLSHVFCNVHPINDWLVMVNTGIFLQAICHKMEQSGNSCQSA